MYIDVLGADVGSRNTKLWWHSQSDVFDSSISTAKELKLGCTDDDMVIDFGDVAYFVGDVAKRESRTARTPKGNSKVRALTLIRLLAGMARNHITHAKLVVIGQPFDTSVETEVKKMQNLIKGEHHFVYNKKQVKIRIDHVAVGPEGAASYFAIPQRPRSCNIIDLGSGTVNMITIRDARIVSDLSHTLMYGYESRIPLDEIVVAIRDEMQDVWKNEPVYVVGGAAAEFAKYVTVYYQNVHTLPNALVSNALGMYLMGVGNLEKYK